MSGLDWFPTLVAAAGDSAVTDALLKGKNIGGKNYRVHLDGYDQLDLITGVGPSKRNEVWYFAEGRLGAVRIGDYKFRFIDQPSGWLGSSVAVDMPFITNLRLDPFERANVANAPPQLMDFFAHEFWRFVHVQQQVAKLADTFVAFPPMQKGAAFNIEGVKEQVAAAIRKKQGE
jgi:arylsulfatase